MIKKWMALTCKVAVSGGLIWYLLDSIDIDVAVHQLAQTDLFMLLVAVIVLLFQIIISGFRWTTVLWNIEVLVPFWNAIRLIYIGMFFNQTLPGGNGGDLIRIYLIYKGNWGFRGAFNGVILERLSMVIALVVLVIVTLPFFLENLDEVSRSWVVPAVALISFAVVFCLGLLCLLDRVPTSFRRWRLVRGLGNLAQDSRRVFFRFWVAFRSIGWSLLGHINVSIAVYVLACSLNLELSIFDSIVLMPPVLLIMTIPISIGAWGVRENAMVVSFGLIGVSPEAATLLGLLLGLVSLAVAIPGGLVWLSRRKQGGPSLANVEVELAAAEPKGN